MSLRNRDAVVALTAAPNAGPASSGVAPILANSINDTCRRLGIGRTKAHDLINRGELRTFKIGKKTMIPESELLRFVAERMADQHG